MSCYLLVAVDDGVRSKPAGSKLTIVWHDKGSFPRVDIGEILLAYTCDDGQKKFDKIVKEITRAGIFSPENPHSNYYSGLLSADFARICQIFSAELAQGMCADYCRPKKCIDFSRPICVTVDIRNMTAKVIPAEKFRRQRAQISGPRPSA